MDELQNTTFITLKNHTHLMVTVSNTKIMLSFAKFWLAALMLLGTLLPRLLQFVVLLRERDGDFIINDTTEGAKGLSTVNHQLDESAGGGG